MRGQQDTQVAAGTAVAECTHLSFFCGVLHCQHLQRCFVSLTAMVSCCTLLVSGNLDGEHRASQGLCVLGVE